VRIAGRLVLHDAVRLDGAPALPCSAVSNGAHAMTTLVHVANEVETVLPELRAALAPFEAAASAWNGVLVTRFHSHDSAGLRTAVLTALAVLRGLRAMPGVWAC
jgi:urease accessory protein